MVGYEEGHVMIWDWLHEAPGRKRLTTRKWESQKAVATVIPLPIQRGLSKLREIFRRGLVADCFLV